MKSRFVKMTLLSTVLLASPLLTFAGAQPAKVIMPRNDDARNSEGIARALQQGKGSGMTRSQVVVRANAWRVEKAEEMPAAAQPSAPSGPRWTDTAFHK